MKTNTETPNTDERESKEANTCIALGAGVGGLGGAAAALTGALCPLCVIVAPALIGYGAYKKVKAKKKSIASSFEFTPK